MDGTVSSSRSQKDAKNKLPPRRISIQSTSFNVKGGYKERASNIIQARFDVKDFGTIDMDEEQHKVKVVGKVDSKLVLERVLQNNHND